jgi:hypothetical protein
MSSNEPDARLVEALAKGARAAQRVASGLLDSEQALRVATEALRAAEPDLRRHMMLQIADGLAGIEPKVANDLREAVRKVESDGA